MKHLKRHFITGVLFLLPIAITIGVVHFLLNLITSPFKSFFGEDLGSILILINLLVFTWFVGVVVHVFISRRLIRLGEQILEYIPFIGKVYKACREVIHTVIESSAPSFKQVVLVPFPGTGIKAIGLLVRETGHIGQHKSDKDPKDEEFFSVFVPTTPNPTTGFILIYPKNQVELVDMSVEDALKFIISCGMIIPQPSAASSPTLAPTPPEAH